MVVWGHNWTIRDYFDIRNSKNLWDVNNYRVTIPHNTKKDERSSIHSILCIRCLLTTEVFVDDRSVR